MDPADPSRRSVLGGLMAGAGLVAAGCHRWPAPGGPHRPVREPGDRPDPRRPEGTDLLPQIEHIVVYMQENHSYDSYFGTFPAGDGYRMRRGAPTNANVGPDGVRTPVFHAPDTCRTRRTA